MRRFAVLGMALALAGRPLGVLEQQQAGESARAHDDHTAATGSSQCGPGKPAAAANFKPVKADTLSVVTSLPGPGFWEGSDTDPTKVTSGYEYDIAKCMQPTFGLTKLRVRNVSFDAIVAGTVTNYDLALSQISITRRPRQGRVVLDAVLRSRTRASS